jgi:hypothetical protein
MPETTKPDGLLIDQEAVNSYSPEERRIHGDRRLAIFVHNNLENIIYLFDAYTRACLNASSSDIAGAAMFVQRFSREKLIGLAKQGKQYLKTNQD